MNQLCSASLLNDVRDVYNSLTGDERDMLLQHPLAVLCLQEVSRLSVLERSNEKVSQWTLTLHRQHVQLLEREFFRLVHEIRHRRESA